ncbi:hypothetical protein LJC45_01175 [Alistipes sp. OttesenSCG-928-B03]|nr:hypothetical protein [Alistipes sp. OttesenSCG-928-B03]
MLTAQELVHNHVLYEQNLVVSELLRHGAIPDESLYGEFWEVMEWWLVTPYLAKLLKDECEIVIEEHGCYWWGRQTSGQAIYMDAVMTEIVASFD